MEQRPYKLNYAIELIEEYLGKKAERDLKAIWVDINKA